MAGYRCKNCNVDCEAFFDFNMKFVEEELCLKCWEEKEGMNDE